MITLVVQSVSAGRGAEGVPKWRWLRQPPERRNERSGTPDIATAKPERHFKFLILLKKNIIDVWF